MILSEKMDKLYFDYAAATPLDSKVKKAMEPFWSERFYNASGLYQSAREVRQTLDAARSSVASILAAQTLEVVFTAGATESINLAIQGVMAASPGDIIISAGEHPAVVASAQATGRPVKVCPLKPTGVIDLNKLEKLIDSQTTLVSVQYANNEVGTIQPIHKIGQLVAQISAKRKSNRPLYLHSDGSQAANYLPLKVNRLGVDLLTLNGAKIYGPKHTGCLYIKTGTKLKPLIAGGGQEQNLRGGTENVAGAVGFSVALEIASTSREREVKRLAGLQLYLLQQVLKNIPNTKINGAQKPRLPNNANFSFGGVNGETLLHYLDQAGFMVATGAACHANSDEPSATLLAIGLSPAEANSSLRVTLGRSTTKAQIDRLLAALSISVKRLRAQ